MVQHAKNQMDRHTHRVTPSRWFSSMLVGSFCLIIVAGTLVKNYPPLIAGQLGLLDCVGLLFVVLLMLPFGLLAFLLPFLTKVAVSAEGLEYYTLAAIVKSNWRDLVNVGAVRHAYAGSSKMFVSEQPQIILRGWAKYVPWDVMRGTTNSGIPISHFGGFRGRRLESDIQRFAPQLSIVNNAIEFHDSSISEIKQYGDDVVVSFSSAYVHTSVGRPGLDASSGWIQAVELTLKNSTLPLKLPENLSGPLQGGYLKIDSEFFADAIPRPLNTAGKIELEILFCDGERVAFTGDGIALLALGEARYVEEFPPGIKPL